ncbi:MAG TPA: SDR family oxidoreductase [Solirubrobacterales bacterium]|nr:SDR family oxidoreductase [Solirubrobacterales bacterium]
MEIEGKVAIVTGAGGGIGGAISQALAAAGAKVVVADLDGEAARATAAAIESAQPGAAVGVEADVADRAAIDGLLRTAAETFGPLDLYFANAGVIEGGGGLSDESHWARALDVNVMAHVRAAEAVLPAWLERGEGYFVATASAAGLLTQVGLAPYAVTKHAAVGFAEWLAVTYGDRGIRVSCLCPMGVETAMYTAGLEAEGEEAMGARVVAAAGKILSPDEVAETVLAGVAAERFLILPHPEVLDFYRRKGIDYDGWIEGMRRLQARYREDR